MPVTTASTKVSLVNTHDYMSVVVKFSDLRVTMTFSYSGTRVKASGEGVSSVKREDFSALSKAFAKFMENEEGTNGERMNALVKKLAPANIFGDLTGLMG